MCVCAEGDYITVTAFSIGHDFGFISKVVNEPVELYISLYIYISGNI